MKLTGPQYQQLQRALISAFPRRTDLEQMLMFQLGESLDTVVGSGNLADTVYSLIQWAVARGRLDKLIAGAQAANPGNAELRAFAQQVSQTQAPDPPQPSDRTAPASTTAAAEREHLQGLLAIQQENLRKLERQEALYGGLGVPLSLLNQLDEVRREIASLEARLRVAEPRSAFDASAATPANRTQPTRQRGDTYARYEAAIEEVLRRLGSEHERYSEALTYQQQLAENIDASRRYGDTETTRAERARIIGQLNVLALDVLGMSFNDLM